MRNRIEYTDRYPEELAARPGFVVLDVGSILSATYSESPSDLSADSYTAVSAALRHQIPEGSKHLLLTNVGILCEPELHLNPSKLLLDLALDFEVLLYWTFPVINAKRLVWDTAAPQYGIEFEPTILQRMEQQN